MSISNATYLELTFSDGDNTEVNFTIHQEATRAQKEIDDNNPPGPWPWWAYGSGDFTGGPYQNKVDAIAAVTNHALNRC